VSRLKLTTASSITLIVLSLLVPSNATAGELSTSGVALSWSGPFYETPLGGTSEYQFDYTIPDGVLFGDVTIVNGYGDILNAAGLPKSFSGSKGAGSGSIFVSIRNSESKNFDFSETKACLSVVLRAGAGTTSTCKPIEFLKRQVKSSPKPATSVKQTPASKATSITCIKGKSTVKVTEVKPKCPSGYKLKK
jgi:hypothetical protein